MSINGFVVPANNANFPPCQQDITLKQTAALRCHITALGRTTRGINEIQRPQLRVLSLSLGLLD